MNKSKAEAFYKRIERLEAILKPDDTVARVVDFVFTAISSVPSCPDPPSFSVQSRREFYNAMFKAVKKAYQFRAYSHNNQSIRRRG